MDPDVKASLNDKTKTNIIGLIGTLETQIKKPKQIYRGKFKQRVERLVGSLFIYFDAIELKHVKELRSHYLKLLNLSHSNKELGCKKNQARSQRITMDCTVEYVQDSFAKFVDNLQNIKMHLEGVVIPSAQKESPHESEQVIGFGSEPDVPASNEHEEETGFESDPNESDVSASLELEQANTLFGSIDSIESNGKSYTVGEVAQHKNPQPKKAIINVCEKINKKSLGDRRDYCQNTNVCLWEETNKKCIVKRDVAAGAKIEFGSRKRGRGRGQGRGSNKRARKARAGSHKRGRGRGRKQSRKNNMNKINNMNN